MSNHEDDMRHVTKKERAADAKAVKMAKMTKPKVPTAKKKK
jgi:hypothetical protein